MSLTFPYRRWEVAHYAQFLGVPLGVAGEAGGGDLGGWWWWWW